MEQITLTQDTISAVRAYFDNPELGEGYLSNFIEDAEFQQGDYAIFVDAWIYCHWDNQQIFHNEVTSPNVEDLSGYVLDRYEIMGVWACDKDGEEVEITNKDEL